MSEFQQIIRNPEYDGSSEEDEEIDPADKTPLISSTNVPIVTAPAEDEDRVESDEDRAEDEDRVESIEGRVEDEDEDDAPPGLETDESSSIGDLLGDEGSDSGEEQQAQVEQRPEDKENHCGWDPPSNLLPQEYQFRNAEPEEILEWLQQQVRDLMFIMETKLNWPAACGPEDDRSIVEGLRTSWSWNTNCSKWSCLSRVRSAGLKEQGSLGFCHHNDLDPDCIEGSSR